MRAYRLPPCCEQCRNAIFVWENRCGAHLCPVLIRESSIDAVRCSFRRFRCARILRSRSSSSSCLNIPFYCLQVFPSAFELISAGVSYTHCYCANPFVPNALRHVVQHKNLLFLLEILNHICDRKLVAQNHSGLLFAFFGA